MELAHEFTVTTPVDQAWAVLTDIERIAPCMPGAELTEVDGDTYHGVVKVKVGPITALYKGTASFVEKDEAAHRVVLKAAGRDTRGQGNASATVTAVMTGAPHGTRVEIATDMTVSGRVAQFGRGGHGRCHGQAVAAVRGQPRGQRADLTPPGPGAAAPRAQPGSPNRAARTRNAAGAAPCSQAGSSIHRGT